MPRDARRIPFMCSFATAGSFFRFRRRGAFQRTGIHLSRESQRTYGLLSAFRDGETLTNINVLQSPPSEFLSKYVNFELRNGMCFSLLAKAKMTSPRLERDLLMACASLRRSPVAPVRLNRSLPAINQIERAVDWFTRFVDAVQAKSHNHVRSRASIVHIRIRYSASSVGLLHQ